MLVIARAAQGAFGALLAPSILALLSTTFSEPKERARAFAIFGAVAGTGGAVGLLLGGVLTEYFSWRWCLYVNLVMAAITVAGALALIPRHEPVAERPEARHPRLDHRRRPASSASSTGSGHAESGGWSSWTTLGPIIFGVIALIAFVVIESRVAAPAAADARRRATAPAAARSSASASSAPACSPCSSS